jgi:glycoside/pentoside/hexuronide:cation symporter, GPH family
MTTKRRLTYLLGSMGVGLIYAVTASFTHYFMTTRLGMPTGIAAAQIAIIQVFILFADLLNGQYGGRSRPIFGFHPFMMGGAILASLSTLLLFVVSPLASAWSLPLALIGFGGVLTGLSAYSVVHLSWVPQLAPDPIERARFVGVRMLCMGAGGLIGATLPPMILDLTDHKNGWNIIAAFAFFIGLSLLMIGARNKVGATAPRHVNWSDWGAVFGDLAFRTHLIGALALFSVISALATAAPFFVLWGLEQKIAMLSILLGAQGGANLIGLFVWPHWFKRIGIINGLCGAQAVQAIGLATLLVLPQHFGQTGLLISGALIGFGSAGVMVASYGLLSDLIAKHQARLGVDRSVAMAGLWMAAEKINSGFGRIVAGMILGAGAMIGTMQASIGAMIYFPLSLSLVSIVYYLWQRRLLDPPANPPVSSDEGVGSDANTVLER